MWACPEGPALDGGSTTRGVITLNSNRWRSRETEGSNQARRCGRSPAPVRGGGAGSRPPQTPRRSQVMEQPVSLSGENDTPTGTSLATLSGSQETMLPGGITAIPTDMTALRRRVALLQGVPKRRVVVGPVYHQPVRPTMVAPDRWMGSRGRSTGDQVWLLVGTADSPGCWLRVAPAARGMGSTGRRRLA